MASPCSAFLVAFFVVGMSAAFPSDSTAQPVTATVLVMLQNNANTPSDVVGRAKAEVVRLFGLAGVEVAWVEKASRGGNRLRVVCLTTKEPAEERVSAGALGYTPSNGGRRAIRAYVFWRRVERAAEKFVVGKNDLLAVAIAHEIGHMLLPDGSHAKAGLMQSPWDANHFRSTAAGLLHFSPDTAALIRSGLSQGVSDVPPQRPAR
jgi:hypothetical protein